MFARFIPICIAFIFSLQLSLSQDAEIPAPAPEVAPADIRIQVLALQLDPMTKEEIEEQVTKWTGILREKARNIAEKEILILEDSSRGKELGSELVKLREEKAAIVRRTGMVLEAYELKGGDATTQRQYLSAVRGIQTNVKDVNTRLTALRTWLTSADGGIRIGKQIFKFFSILLIFWIISAFAKKVIARALDHQPHLSSLLKDFINKISRRVIFAIGLVVALGTIGVNVGAALALIGGGAFIIGLALQDTLSNFANGIMLLIYRPFDVGSAVEVGGIRGKVDSVSMVTTTILTFDNQKVLVPNKKVWGEVITNITGMTNRRVDLLFGIGYSDNIEKAQEIIEKVVAENTLILADPLPNIGVHELGDSSVNIRCWVWAATADYLNVKTGVMRRVKEEFDTAGISIPFPQRDLHVYNAVTPVIEQ